MIRLPLDIAACYEAMRKQAAKNVNFDLLAYVRKRLGQAIENEKKEKYGRTKQI